MTAPRWLVCEVPWCLHKRGQRKGEPELEDGMRWICGEHWRNVPSHIRRRLKLQERLAVRAEAKGKPNLARMFRLQRGKLWDEARRLAIEIAVGITAARRSNPITRQRQPPSGRRQ